MLEMARGCRATGGGGGRFRGGKVGGETSFLRTFLVPAGRSEVVQIFVGAVNSNRFFVDVEENNLVPCRRVK